MTSAHDSTNNTQTSALPASDVRVPSVSPSLRLRETLKDAAPMLSLFATLGAAALFYFGSEGSSAQIIGFARTSPQTVAPIETGRLHEIRVQVGDRVVAGQIVATLDTSTLDAEIAVAEARIAQLEAEMLAEQVLLEQQLDGEIAGLKRERARQREEQLRVGAEAKVLDGEVARVKRLVEQKQAVLDDLSQLGLRQATANALLDAKPQMLGLLSKQIENAEQRRDKTKGKDSVLALKLTAGVLVAERNVELLRRRRESYILRAGRAGRVSLIERWPGDVVDATKPVLQIVSAERTVVGCVPEAHALGLREGDTAKLHVRGQSTTPLRGKVTALGPLVTELPSRCWNSPKVPLWGREVTVLIDEPAELVPGQAFEISFEHGTGAPPAPSGTAVAGAGSVPMKIPQDLFARTRFEPSGVLARPAESRYLLVSDDTGRDATEGVPWLFAMSPNGEVSSEPVVVSGVTQINDLEAITSTNEGEVFVLSSQSYSKKGKRKPSRTALLRLRPEGQGLTTTGEAHIAPLLDADPERATALGLPLGTRDLDIEGLAFRDGALYMGLKAPLNERGEAIIWKFATPAALFDPQATNVLESAGATLWATVRIDVEMGSMPVQGGISEMLFLSDGSLALASTPSIAEGAAGAVWRVDEPKGGTLSPRLIQRFPDKKPEGLAPSLSAGKLMVVFDMGDGAPHYQEIPWAP